jgi:hypothetical protein
MSDLFTMNGSDYRYEIGHIPRVFWGNPRGILRYLHVLDSIKTNTKVVMSAATTFRINDGGVIVDLMLEDLEDSIGRFVNDFCQFHLQERREICIWHASTICRLYDDSEWCRMERSDAGMKT